MNLKDEIVEEIRAAGDTFLARFNYDLADWRTCISTSRPWRGAWPQHCCTEAIEPQFEDGA